MIFTFTETSLAAGDVVVEVWGVCVRVNGGSGSRAVGKAGGCYGSLKERLQAGLAWWLCGR